MLTAPSPRGARPRLEISPRVPAAYTSEPSTAERAGLPGPEWVVHAARAQAHLKVAGLAIGKTHRNWTRWRAAQ